MGKFKKIYIEITNVCNLACDFCPKTRRKPLFMDYSLFEHALLEAKPLCDEITLHVMGEPLLHPDFGKMILLAEKNDVRINLTTNGTIIKGYETFLLNNAIRRINFSIHGLLSNFDKEKQENHLKEIIAFTKRAQEEREDLIITYRLWNIEKDSADPNSSILGFIGKEFDIDLIGLDEKKSMKIKNNAFVHYDESFEWPDPDNPIRSTKGYCHALSTHIGILAEGTVVPCCLDNEGLLSLGSIKEQALDEILRSNRAKSMREGFRRRILAQDLCRRCTYIKRFEKEKDIK